MSVTPKYDGYSANVSLLLPFDEDLTDYSGSSKSLTAFGDAAVSATQKRYGPKSLALDGTGDYVSVAYNSAWQLGSADFTIEVSAYFTSLPATQYPALIGQYDPEVNKRSFELQYLIDSAQLRFLYSADGISASNATVSYSMPLNEWHDYCVERIGNVLNIYVDGVQVYTGAITATFYATTIPLFIGARRYESLGSEPSAEMFGYIDEVRVTNGVGRYDGNYTPESFFEAFSSFSNTIIESVTATDTPSARGYLQGVLLELLIITEAVSATGGHGIVDALVSEYLTMTADLSSLGILGQTVEETTTATDTPLGTLYMASVVSESVTATCAILSPYIERLIESLTAAATATSGAKFTRVCTESAEINGVITPAWTKTLSEQVTLTATAVQRFEVAVALVEHLMLSEAVPSRLHAVMTVALSLVISDQVAAGKGAMVSETTTLTATLLDRLYATALALDTATMTATAAMTLRLSLPITETAELTSTFSATAKLRDLITEGVAFELSFNTGEATYTGWVMNTKNFAVTEYQNFPFNSFAKVGSAYLGANSQGLYLLTGDTDAGDAIEATTTLGITDLASDKLKRLDSIYLGFRANGDIVLKILTEANIEYWYEAQVTTEKFHQHRVKISRAIEAVTWQLTLVNTDGADFELKTVEFVPVILSRRT